MSNAKLRTEPKSILRELEQLSLHMERYFNADRPVRRSDLEELKFLISQAEDHIELYGKHMYDQGRTERSLFDE
jgi:hypothetical protein